MTGRPREVNSGDALTCTQAARDWRHRWLTDLRTRVFEEGEPFIVADGVAPHEILHVMDVPVVSVPWYSAVISAKRLSGFYFDYLEERGYHAGLPRYASLPMAAALHGDPEVAPYGGLPRPAFMLARLRGDYGQRVTELWASALGCPLYVLDASSDEALDPRWFEKNRHGWEELYGTHRLDFQVEQIRGLIAFAERTIGRRFDWDVFEAQMHRVNELGEAAEEAKNVLAGAARLPVAVPEQLQNIMTPTWFRGDQWATDHVRLYRDELTSYAAARRRGVREREGPAAMAQQRAVARHRLLPGLRGEPRRRLRVDDVHELPVGRLSQIFGTDPLRALAARHISMNEQLHINPWMSEWILQMAKDFRADGAVMLTPSGDRMAGFGTRGTVNACEAAGLPVVELEASMVDERSWDRDAMTAEVARIHRASAWCPAPNSDAGRKIAGRRRPRR